MTANQIRPATAEVRFRPISGPEVSIVIDSEQLHGRRCIGCGTDQNLIDAGHVHTQTGQALLGWAVRSCEICMAAER